MERKIATKLTPRIAEFVNSKSKFGYSSNKLIYFHYPNLDNSKGFKDRSHTSFIVQKDYQKVTEQEFINYFNEKETMKKKFIDISETSKPEKKETVFTHYLNNNTGWQQTKIKPEQVTKVYYLGKCENDVDIFAVCYDEEMIVYKGIKGDEFNS